MVMNPMRLVRRSTLSDCCKSVAVIGSLTLPAFNVSLICHRPSGFSVFCLQDESIQITPAVCIGRFSIDQVVATVSVAGDASKSSGISDLIIGLVEKDPVWVRSSTFHFWGDEAANVIDPTVTRIQT